MRFTHDIQQFAETLPARVERAATVYADGQGDVLGPIEAQFRNVNSDYGTTRSMSWGGYYQPEVGANDVGDDIANYGELAEALPGNRTLSLGSLSGSLMREMHTSSPGRRTGTAALIDPRAFGSSNGVGRLDHLGAGKKKVEQRPWYENPVYLGAGSVAIIGTVWFLTRK